ncbi:methylenetetrahydrofolate reductase [Flaviflexus massiliensis]|uniref:methylenetetrahydrofolate reductase n=1 Tax=Flaviflexus massiliensis TaxID=1522309 RepID=UPI0006D556B8|nr:methylenetetrahydrofolate reductase [Flaviflexus massiliensis]
MFSHNNPLISFELMPPRRPDHAPKFWATVDRLMAFRPDFVSVTYGAGGKDSSTSFDVITKLVRHTPVQPIAHITCVGTSRDLIAETLTNYLNAGVRTFLALRGDPPVDEPDWTPSPDSLQSAVELVTAIRQLEAEACQNSPGAALRNAFKPLTIAVATFANGNPAAGTSVDDEVNRLLVKQAAGASFAITQMLWEAEPYATFVEKARRAGVHIPILPGLIPPVESRRLRRSAELSGIEAPHHLLEALEQAELENPDVELIESPAYWIGIEYGSNLAREVLEAGAPGLHLYTFNRAEPSLSLLHALGLDKNPTPGTLSAPSAASPSSTPLSLLHQSGRPA